jgi:hypothetical protein
MNEMAILGFIPADVNSSAVFRLLNTDGQRAWQYIVSSPLWNFPVSMVKTSKGYILISVENDYSPLLSPSTLVFTLVSDQGASLMRQRVPLSIRAMLYSPTHVVLNTSGNLVVAIGGDFSASSSAQGPARWTNPVTGTTRYCTGAPEATEILEIDAESLQVSAQKVIPDIAVASVKLSDGHLFAAGSFSVNCRFSEAHKIRGIDTWIGFENDFRIQQCQLA